MIGDISIDFLAGYNVESKYQSLSQLVIVKLFCFLALSELLSTVRTLSLIKDFVSPRPSRGKFVLQGN